MNTLSDIKPHDYARIQEEDFNLIRDTANGIYVEVGTFHGASAYAASQNAKKIVTIDIYDWKSKVYEDSCDIYFFKGTAEDYSKSFHHYWNIDVLFIDGSHELDSVKKDIEALEPLVREGGIIMFHDYKKESPTGVYPAVQEYLKRCNPKILREPTKGSSILKVQKC